MAGLRDTPVVFGVLVSLVAAGGAKPGRADGPSAALTTRPNIVMVLVDDLDKALFDRMYDDGLLPAIRDHIGDPGTTFTHAFVSEPLCCPSRATYLTGQYPHNHGVLDNWKPLGGVTRLADATALPVWLQGSAETYVNALVGKYLNGYGGDNEQPLTSAENETYVPAGWHFWRGQLGQTMYNYRVTQWDALGDTVQVVTYGTGDANYQTRKLAQMAASFIAGLDQAHDDLPFFLYVAPNAPHQVKSDAAGVPRTSCSSPYWNYLAQPEPQYTGTLPSYAASLPQPAGSYNEADVSDKPDFIRGIPRLTAAEVQCARLQYQRRAESMRSVDDLVGTLVARLQASGELENTILVFTSDNGYFLGNHRLCCKVIAYEEAIRVPLMMAGPGIPAGATRDQLVLNNDLAPTFAEWAQVSPSVAVDGRSLVPLLQDPSHSWRKRFLGEFQGQNLDGPAVPRYWIVRTGADDEGAPNAFYARWTDASGSVEYYDLSPDPDQTQSRHADPATAPQRAAMEGYLGDLRDCGRPGYLSCAAAEN